MTRYIDATHAERAVADRRWFHQHAELSNKEFETTHYIEQAMQELGLEIHRTGDTGLIATLCGKHPGPTLGIRADIDALPLQEENCHSYRSLNDGVMHACGHDAHTASLMAAARYLADHREDIGGTVKFMFQPAEEYFPSGALRLLNTGYLDDCDAFLGFHVQSQIPVGKYAISKGAICAASCSINVDILGKGGHGGVPQSAVDATVAACAVVMNLQTFVSRELDPFHPLAVSIGVLYSGTAKNIISERAHMEGTIRYFDMEEASHFQVSLRRIAENTAAAFGARAEVEFVPGLDPVINEGAMTEYAVHAAVAVRGEESVIPADPGAGCDDFCYYCNRRPSVYVNIGAMNEAKIPAYGHHNPRFDIDEDCIANAADFICQFVKDYCHP